MNKLYVTILIIGFWLFLPIPFMLMNTENYDRELFLQFQDKMFISSASEESTTDSNNFQVQISTFFNNVGKFLHSIFFFIGMYFNILLFGITGAPYIINLLLVLMKFISVIVLFFIIRGTD